MNLSRLSVCALSITALASAAQAVILNGSLTGPVGASIVPPSWAPAIGSPDTVDASGPFNGGLPWVLSPDGGTFVRAGSNGVSTFETMSQTMTGLTIGVLYEINFFQTNLGFVAGAMTGDTGYWDFGLDGSPFATSTPIPRPATISDLNVWSAGSVTFLATAVSQSLTVGANMVAGGSPAAYMGIDGLRLKQVPAPGALGLLTLVGATTIRRRRR